MTRTMTTRTGAAPAATSARTAHRARALLACGVAAGPLYLVVGLTQAFTRDGFDLRRHALSLLSNGDLGWIQIGNFLVSGLLVLACAVGLRRALRSGRGRTWGPRLVGCYGVGLVAAAVFRADPALGFPVGTPADANAVSWHGLLHFVSATFGFLALIAACLVFARRFRAGGQRGWAAYCVATGMLFLAAFLGIASGTGRAWINIAFCVAVVIVWAWISVLAARLMTAPATASVTAPVTAPGTAPGTVPGIVPAGGEAVEPGRAAAYRRASLTR